MRSTMREKLGQEMDDYLILGLCNPSLASPVSGPSQTRPHAGSAPPWIPCLITPEPAERRRSGLCLSGRLPLLSCQRWAVTERGPAAQGRDERSEGGGGGEEERRQVIPGIRSAGGGFTTASADGVSQAG